MVLKKDESISSYPTICFASVGSLVAADAIWFGHPSAVMVVYAALIHVVFRNNISSGKVTLRFLFRSAGFLVSGHFAFVSRIELTLLEDLSSNLLIHVLHCD